MSMHSQTVRHFSTLLVENKISLLQDEEAIDEIKKLKNIISNIEDLIFNQKAKEASNKIAKMSEEERKMLLMWPEEKKFFLKYKKLHPENPWGYLEEFQKHIEETYNKTGKIALG